MYYWLSPIRDAALRALMVLTAALFPPLVLPLATGFGNGLIVVLFLGAALTLLRGNGERRRRSAR